MHHGTCVTHVPWCMSGSLASGGGENVPGIPGACAPAIFCIWQEAHGIITYPYPNINKGLAELPFKVTLRRNRIPKCEHNYLYIMPIYGKVTSSYFLEFIINMFVVSFWCFDTGKCIWTHHKGTDKLSWTRHRLRQHPQLPVQHVRFMPHKLYH